MKNIYPNSSEERAEKRAFIRTMVFIIGVIIITTIGIMGFIQVDTVMKMQIDTLDQLNYVRQEVEDLNVEVDNLRTNFEVVVSSYDVPLHPAFVWEVIRQSKINGYDPKYTFAVIKKESSFDVDAVSRTNDYGLMQINKSNFGWLQSDFCREIDFMDPKQNIMVGAYMIGQLLKIHNGNVDKALMVYNMGGNKAKSLWAQGVYETDYTKKVMATYYQS